MTTSTATTPAASTTTSATQTTLASDIHKVLTDMGSDVEGATTAIMDMLNPPATPPAAGTFAAAFETTVAAGKAWFSALGPLAVPVMIGAGVVLIYDNFKLITDLVTKL